MKKFFIPVILGTARVDRKSHAAAKFVQNEIGKHEAVETELIDVKEHVQLPTTPPWGKGGANEVPTKWKEIAERADGFIIVSPEYNHGYPGELKLLLDSLCDEYKRKPVALCGVSSGIFGGARLLDHIKPVLIELKMIPIRDALYFTNIEDAFTEDGEIKEYESFSKRTTSMLEELLFFARALREGKES